MTRKAAKPRTETISGRTLDDLIKRTRHAILQTISTEQTMKAIQAQFIDLVAENNRLKDERAELVEAMLAYNSLVRSAHEVAKRQGEKTNWQTFANRLDSVLKENHETFKKYYYESDKPLV